MKAILVPVEVSTRPKSLLDTALLLARSLNAYVEAFPLGPEIPDVYGMDFPVVIPPILDQDWRREEIQKARDELEQFMGRHDVSRATDRPQALSFGWTGDTLQGDSFLGDYGRAFDIIVVAQPASGEGARPATLEEALFNSGRPILVAPQAPPAQMGRTIVVAWNGGTETARTISFAMPLLLRAERVVVLTVEGGTVPGPTGEQVARTLRINGVPAQAVDAAKESRPVGETILSRAGELGADLLVKGGYTQSRLREMIFGGPTRHLLEHSTLPIFLAH